eukprot:scaffold3084_cov144-Cylindrotheca_fusiformis.AAC.48
MGGTCSRHRSSWRRDSQQNNRDNRQGSGGCGGNSGRCFSRHSIGAAMPDDSISNLYLPSDNYINEDDGTRSPKTLAALSTNALCRALPYLDGELPPGLPQDVVDEIVRSLVKQNALNATTLKVLRNCEISSLNLAGCRGVTDSWLEPFVSTCGPNTMDCTGDRHDACVEQMDVDDLESDKSSDVFYSAASDDTGSHTCGDGSSESTSSYQSASSVPWKRSKTDQLRSEDVELPSHDSLKRDFLAVNAATSIMTLLDLRGSYRLTDRGLRHLSDLSSLEVARLDNCHSLVGRGLLAFSLSHRLHTLSLANCRRLTDEAIINISHLNSLQALSLDGCRCLTDRSLAALSGLYLLKKLDLSQCDLITDAGLKFLQDLKEIEELSLGWCRKISSNGLGVLTNQPGRSSSLRILSLARCMITNTGVDFLRRLQNLEELDLNGCTDISSSALGKALQYLTKLTTLDVSYCPGILRTSWQGRINSLKSLMVCYAGVRDNQMSHFSELPALEELNLDSCLVSDWTIAHFAENNVAPNLVSLDMADTDLSDLGMVHLAKFKKLKRLSLFYCNISNSGLRHLSQLACLEALNLDSRAIGDDGLYHLRNLTHLKALDIFSGRITDAGCYHISNIKSLESLELCGGGIGDPGCSMLASLENLTSLNLSQNDRITNRGAASLAALSKLKALNLSNTRVNSSVLVHFSSLRSLQSLAVYGCSGMTDLNGIDRLQNQLPSLKCIRLNNGSDDNGLVTQGESDVESEYSDDDSTSSGSERPLSFYPRRSYAGLPNISNSSDDDDSEMGDAVQY